MLERTLREDNVRIRPEKQELESFIWHQTPVVNSLNSTAVKRKNDKTQ